MNNPIRAWSQRALETPMLFGRPGALAGKRALEIGCGRGVGIEILLALGAKHVVGFDIDPRMIVLAQERTARFGKRVQIFLGDAERIEAPNGSFDVVVDYGILHHIPDWRHTLTEVSRILKPGSMFYFEDILKGFTSAWPMRILLDHPQATQFTGEAFRAGMLAVGLRVTRWRQFWQWGVTGCAVADHPADT